MIKLAKKFGEVKKRKIVEENSSNPIFLPNKKKENTNRGER